MEWTRVLVLCSYPGQPRRPVAPTPPRSSAHSAADAAVDLRRTEPYPVTNRLRAVVACGPSSTKQTPMYDFYLLLTAPAAHPAPMRVLAAEPSRIPN